MLPDRFGSDRDYDTVMGNRVEDGEWCQHGQRRENCGKCWEQAMDDAESDWWADTAPSLEAVVKMTDEMLRRLERRAEGA